MSSTPYVELFAALWGRLFGLDRYAESAPGQIPLFNKDAGPPGEGKADRPTRFPNLERHPDFDYIEKTDIQPGGSGLLTAVEHAAKMARGQRGVLDAQAEKVPEGIAVHTIRKFPRLKASQILPRGTKPSLEERYPLASENASSVEGVGKASGDLFPHVQRDPAFSWHQRSTVYPSLDSARTKLAQEREARGFHQGEVVPDGPMFRVNRLFRFPHVKYK